MRVLGGFIVLLLAPACALAGSPFAWVAAPLTLSPHGKSGLTSVAAPLRTPRSFSRALPLQSRQARHATAAAQTRMSSIAEPEALRTMFSPAWACMANCGACCYLAPEERNLEGLSDADRALYTSMAGEDGWCTHFDKETRLCGQFEERPGFCRIENLGSMYGMEDEEEMGDFAADACRDHIDSLFGEKSSQIQAFETLQADVRVAELEGVKKQLLARSAGPEGLAAGVREVVAELDQAIKELREAADDEE